MQFLLAIVVIVCGVCTHAIAIDSSNSSERINVLIVPPVNSTGDDSVSHWRFGLTALLEQQLGMSTQVCVVPKSSERFARNELNLKTNPEIPAEKLRQLGLLIEAQYVVTGDYRRDGEKWKITTQVLLVASNRTSKPLTFASSDWFEIASAVRSNIFSETGIAISQEEREKMARRPTPSAEALELMSLAMAMANRDTKPLAELEATLRKSIQLDSEFAAPRQALANICLFQGKVDEARQYAEAAVRLRPDLASTHHALGMVLFMQDLKALARSEFEQAIRIDPSASDSYFRLAEIYGLRGNWAKTAVLLEEAKQFAPYDATLLGLLAQAHIQLRDSDKAMTELRAAEKLANNDPGAEQVVAECFQSLNDEPKALEHFQRCIALSKEAGMDSRFTEDVQKKVQQLSLKLSSHFISTPSLEKFSTTQLEGRIKELIKPEEYELVTNPLKSSTEMDRWADELVKEASDETDKAKRLFEGLSKRLNPTSAPSPKSAVETFRAWSDTSANLACQDLTMLYVSLARHVGLRSFYVLVDRDYTGRVVNHACAGVLLADKALLVDLTYRWFGAPHQVYEFESDLRVISFYLTQSDNRQKEDIALKLAPEWGIPYFAVAQGRAKRGDMTRASEAMKSGMQLDSVSWRAVWAEASIESVNSKDWKKVSENFQRCLQVGPEGPEQNVMRLNLATALAMQGDLKAAREEYRKYLEGPTVPEQAVIARDSIAWINQHFRMIGDGRSKRKRRKNGRSVRIRIGIGGVSIFTTNA